MKSVKPKTAPAKSGALWSQLPLCSEVIYVPVPRPAAHARLLEGKHVCLRSLLQANYPWKILLGRVLTKQHLYLHSQRFMKAEDAH